LWSYFPSEDNQQRATELALTCVMHNLWKIYQTDKQRCSTLPGLSWKYALSLPLTTWHPSCLSFASFGQGMEQKLLDILLGSYGQKLFENAQTTD